MVKKRTLLFIFFSSLFITYQSLSSQQFALFSPQNKPKRHLLSFIKKAKNHIYAALYLFTDYALANALIDAHKNRFVDVQLIVDAHCLEHPCQKISLLEKHHIPVSIYRPGQFRLHKNHRIMHHKFALIDNLIWTGSFNWTHAAEALNYENVIVSDDSRLRRQYEVHFADLKKVCLSPRHRHTKKE